MEYNGKVFDWNFEYEINKYKTVDEAYKKASEDSKELILFVTKITKS